MKREELKNIKDGAIIQIDACGVKHKYQVIKKSDEIAFRPILKDIILTPDDVENISQDMLDCITLK